MNSLEIRLANYPFLILDGAMATELERKGADLNDPLWSAKVLLDQPGLIQETHHAYLQAGADIICTSTYQATFAGFLEKGISKKRATELFQLSVRLAIDAKEEFCSQKKPHFEPLIAASIGPYGAYLADGSEYTGIYEMGKNGLKSFHRDRLELLIELGVDLLLFETFPNQSEVEAMLELLSELPNCPALFSFSCKDGNLADGSPFHETALLASGHERVAVVGVNCLHPDKVVPLLGGLKNLINKPLLAYPNNGNLWDAQNKCWVGNNHSINMDQLWTEWLGLGVKIIGGCCNTSPSYIQQLHLFREKLL